MNSLSLPTRFAGAPLSARAWILLQALAQNAFPQLPALVLCPDEEQARELFECLLTLAAALKPSSSSSSSSRHEERFAFFPHWDHSLYSSVKASPQVRFERLKTLSRLTQNSTTTTPISRLELVISTLPAISQVILPPQAFCEALLHFRLGDQPAYGTLASSLTERGYLECDLVEDPGTFSLRGEIIDLFPSDASLPTRLELGEDGEISRISFFHPDTQVSTRQARAPGDATPTSPQTLRVPPAYEVLFQAQHRRPLLTQLKNRALELKWPLRKLESTLQAAQRGQFLPDALLWAPFCFATPNDSLDDGLTNATSTLCDYLAHPTSWVWNEQAHCLKHWQQFFDAQIAENNALLKPSPSAPHTPTSYRLLPPPEALFLPPERLMARSKQGAEPQGGGATADLFFDLLQLTEMTPAAGSKPALIFLPMKTPQETWEDPTARHQSLEQFSRWLLRHQKQGTRMLGVVATATQAEEVRAELAALGCAVQSSFASQLPGLYLVPGRLSGGFYWEQEQLMVLNLSEGRIKGLGSGPKKARPSPSPKKQPLLGEFQVGDSLIHRDYGLGRYQGLSRLTLSGAPSDFVTLEYAGADRLYVPVDKLAWLQKYLGPEAHPPLDLLGSPKFQKTLQQVREDTETLAFELVQLYAQRKKQKGLSVAPPGADFSDFISHFPFSETPDQLSALEAIESDLQSGQPMDRLICGDVGFGKTEIAMRAAFQVIASGYQVALLAPTTLLAQQHEVAFQARFRAFPILIRSVSRFKSAAQQKTILQELAQGKIDLIIGTHRLLSNDIQFQNLGLIVVDEEHRFGVRHKEKLKTLKTNTHALALSATPIPRTLHMTLGGLREMSLLRTPPKNRLPIRTYLAQFSLPLIEKAIEFEIQRGGQVYFLHPRIETLLPCLEQLQALMPHVRFAAAHGQMPSALLEKQMLAFHAHEIQVLLCTTIIESGLDVPNANTLLVNRADLLGLSQLYQIRGRVGRSTERAVAYLLIPEETEVSEDALLRLNTLQKNVELGSGFQIALHDLEARGGGDIIGSKQSGNIASVGFDLYLELLEEAMQGLDQSSSSLPAGSAGAHPRSAALKNEPDIHFPFAAYLGEDYIPPVHQRLALYRRLSVMTDDAEILELEAELADRFGALPLEAKQLLMLMRLKILLRNQKILKLKINLQPKASESAPPSPAISLPPQPTLRKRSGSTTHALTSRPQPPSLPPAPTPSLPNHRPDTPVKLLLLPQPDQHQPLHANLSAKRTPFQVLADGRVVLLAPVPREASQQPLAIFLYLRALFS